MLDFLNAVKIKDNLKAYQPMQKKQKCQITFMITNVNTLLEVLL